jgi:hypothetical protein
MASKAAFDMINEVFDFPCYKGSKGKLRDCAVSQDFKPANTSLKVVFTRHPFDRLIIEYRHQKSVQNEVKSNSRKLLFSRHRNWKKKGKKGSHQFREFVKDSVLGPNSTVFPVTQVSQIILGKTDDQKLFCRYVMSVLEIMTLYTILMMGWSTLRKYLRCLEVNLSIHQLPRQR